MAQLKTIPDHTAVRVALWRALHGQVDALPHIIEDQIGLRLAAPESNWRERPDMHPDGTRGYRASIVGRARFIEDLVLERCNQGVSQYVVLGAGLDTFAQRHPESAAKLSIFEIDEPATQDWKRARLKETGIGIAENLHFVPVDFEAGESWLRRLKASGFKASQPSVITSTGVSMYLTLEANKASLREVASLARGSTLAMTFTLPLDLIAPAERSQHEMVYERAKAAGTPFLSFFRPAEILQLAREAGFRKAEHVSREEIIRRYFSGRTDRLEPASGEEYLIAST